MVSISAGGAHSACITSSGELYTWGKGRYGRLGHGDSEDQPKPKMVRFLHISVSLTLLHSEKPKLYNFGLSECSRVNV